MSAHTPGPWTVIDASALGGWFVGPSETYIVCARSDWGHRAQESLANARLIAAAPELLAALRPFADIEECGAGVQIGHSDDHTGESCQECADVLRARAAIAKAEGK